MRKIIIFILLSVLMFSCERYYYEQGPNISFRTKFSRITGKWKLVSIQGIKHYKPEVEQYIELTKTHVEGACYMAKFTNFQQFTTNGSYNDTQIIDTLYTEVGYWAFKGENIWSMSQDYLKHKEGLLLDLFNQDQFTHYNNYKIIKLTNEDLIIGFIFINRALVEEIAYYTFKKIK